MTFLEIEYGSIAYRKECELRHLVLRAPLGLSLDAEALSRERHELHFGLFDGDTLVACVVAHPLTSIEAKIRQLAVRDEHQSQGYGRRMMQCLEEHLAGKGFTSFSMHSRLSAVGFYEKLGYSKVGLEFMEVGIPHVKMEKHLAKRSHGTS